MISIYLQGLFLGLAYAAPIGIQNLFVINSAVSQKLGRTAATALIVAFWDISLGLACFLGAGALLEALPWLQEIVLGGGGMLVIYIGIGLLRSQADMRSETDVNQPLWKLIGTAFIVTWLNPQALIDGTLMLGAFRASLPLGSDSYFIIGFASASAIWFNCPYMAESYLRHRDYSLRNQTALHAGAKLLIIIDLRHFCILRHTTEVSFFML